MASTQKRWLTQPTSKLSKVDLQTALRKDAAWERLSPETRQELYHLLPVPQSGDPPHDINVHPLRTQYKAYIEEELRRWQDELKEGREAKKWREDAMRAAQDRAEGKWDEWKEERREKDWGWKDENSTLEPKEGDEKANIEQEREVEATV